MKKSRLRTRLSSSRRESAGMDLPTDAATPIPIPDILNLEPRISGDSDAVHELLELAFLGREDAKRIDRELGVFHGEGSGWSLDLFAEDLFVQELIRSCFTLRVGGLRFEVNRAFLYNVLSDPPTEVEAVRFRQEILRELEEDPELLASLEKLYRELSQLLAMFKQPDHAARLDINAFRLDLLKLAKWIIDWMVSDFGEARSGLRRLHDVGLAIQASDEYRTLADLLDYESRQSTLRLSVQMGADGELKSLLIDDIEDNTDNQFYRGTLKRIWDRVSMLLFYGYRLSQKEIVGRLLREVYLKISPSLTPLVQMVGQIELYLATRSFKRRVEGEGLAMCLPVFDGDRPLELNRVFNPLLLGLERPAVPCDIHCHGRQVITVITGPNSGGKTRLLQALGLTQLLGQAGLYVPAAEANLPLIRGMFVSLVESETASQAEGRLGRELLRIRHLFESMGTPSLVILDELCSGTNPAEGTEIFSLVVRLLGRLETSGFISTHFLDHARELRDHPPEADLEFLQVETDDKLASTYQFRPGVAETSLAAATAERLGVSFDKLSALIDERRESDELETTAEVEVAG
ncbi:MAG: DNA mismatch repair protein [bacterium]|nr:DNA mismatch repair protein [bacterium]